MFKSISERSNADHSNTAYNLPERSDKPDRPFDACRIHGALTLNKVAGNFHIIGGRSLQLPRGHVHISPTFDESRLNFSHRINRFSFGDATQSLVHSLEGDEKVFNASATIAQYFIEVVPTVIESLLGDVDTFQYSVKENIRPLDHDHGSHGIPGIYFKYDMSALQIIVLKKRPNIVPFCIRLASVISGIVVISGVLNALLQNAMLCVAKRRNPNDAVLRKMSAAPVAVGPTSACNLLLNAASVGQSECVTVLTNEEA